MVVHWWRQRGTGWRTSIWFNAVGCAMSAIVLINAGVTKFTEGAWVSLLIVVGFTVMALLIRRYHGHVHIATALDSPRRRPPAAPSRPRSYPTSYRT